MVFNGIIALIQDLKIELGFKKLLPQDIQFLENHFFYSHLKPEHKKDFQKRLIRFIQSKSFIARGGLGKVTKEMVLTIGATAVMVTFGFRRVTLRHFSKILIYPNNYYSTINQQYHQGEVNPRLGIIVLSWESLQIGNEDPSNGINLGIHELAHALKLENQIHSNGESDFFNPEVWLHFSKLAFEEQNLIETGGDSIFRPAAATNPHEFFAVALETFFEKPGLLKQYNPEMYGTLVMLLKQDPISLNMHIQH